MKSNPNTGCKAANSGAPAVQVYSKAVNRPNGEDLPSVQVIGFQSGNGSGGGTRTPDTRIMMPRVTLFSLTNFVKPCPDPSHTFKHLPGAGKPPPPYPAKERGL